MANTINLKAKGLYTYANFLSSIPEGALLDATNVVIDRDGIVEPRRGIKGYGEFGSGSDIAKQLLDYKQKILVHYDSKLAYDNGSGTFTDFSGAFASVDPLIRIKGTELNGNFYVTTNLGIQKIASASTNLATATVTSAGGVKALDGTGVVDYSNPGFFTGLSKVAYRIVWGTRDVNSNLILGSPSSRIVVTNYDTNSGTINLTFAVPQDITTNYFYQIYRTSVFTALTSVLLDELDPGDEMKLVIEDAYTSGTSITVNDITPESFQSGGTLLYTNPISGEGILQANERPPVAKDIALFKNSIFYANTRTRHNLAINLLGVSGFHSGAITNVTATNPAVITSAGHGLISGDRVAIVGTGAAAVDSTHVITRIDANTFSIPVNGTGAAAATGSFYSSYLTVSDGVTTTRYFFVGRPEITRFTMETKANTTDSSWFEISSANNLVRYAVWFDKTGSSTAPTTSGKVQIRVNISADTTAAQVAARVVTAVETATNDFDIVQATANLTFTNANSGPSTDAAAGTTTPYAGFAAAILISQQGFGEDATKHYVRWSTFTSAAQSVDDTARSLINMINANSSEVAYGYYLSGPDDVPGLMEFESRSLSSTSFTIIANNTTVGNLFNPDLTTTSTSSNEVSVNRLYFSKYQQPEAVPIVNYLDIGPKDKQIYRIVALRDSLFILKEEGIYRLTGDSATAGFSQSLFDGSCHLIAPDTAAVMNNQIYCLTDDGVSTVTETGVGIISRPIENYFHQLTLETFPNFFQASFGEAYHTEHSYYIWTVTNPTDTYATQCFRYNSFTQTWTRWDKAQTCIHLMPFQDKLYFGSPTDNLVEIERKTNSRFDYADGQFATSIADDSTTDTTIVLPTTVNSSVGDAIIQTQYVTINNFNTLLLKLDSDPRIGLIPGSFDTDYYTTLAMIKGDNLTNKFQLLVAKLNLDPGTSHGYAFSGSTDFATIQTEYNVMITAMNADAKLKFTNYQLSSGTIDFELTITAVNNNTKTITADTIPPLMVGIATEYESIAASIIWAPVSMTDPSLLKHVRESTMLFENSAFRGGKIAYNTDLSPSFEEVTFVMDGNGSWGSFVWGQATWGGAGTSIPFRTYVPRQKQRCRFIKARFKHSDAFYKFSILGMSYAFEISSDRAYRGRS